MNARIKRTAKELPLTVAVEGQQVVIRIGIDTLAFCADHMPAMETYNDETGEYGRLCVVVDKSQLAKDVVRELCREEEDGTTPMMELLDKSIVAAMEDGSLAFSEVK